MCLRLLYWVLASPTPPPLSGLIIASSLCVTPSGGTVSLSVCQLYACPFICLFLPSACSVICLFHSSACSIHLPVQFICLFNSSAFSNHLAVPFICLFHSSACPVFCLFHSSACPLQSSACSIHLLLQSSACSIHLLVQSSACSIHLLVQSADCFTHLLLQSSACSSHLALLSSAYPFISLSIIVLVLSYACTLICLSVHVCVIHQYLSIHLYSTHLSSYFKFTTCSDSWDKAHSTPSQPKWAEIATCTTLSFLSGYQKWASKLSLSPPIANPQIFGFVLAIANQQISQLCRANRKFLWLIHTSQYRKFLQNTARPCLKTVLKVNVFVYEFKLEHYMLYFVRGKVCKCGLRQF